jgi:hypothetical protein
MSARNDADTEIEALLDDLYTNEINVSLLWNRMRGFHATLGSPALAEAWFQTALRLSADSAIRPRTLPEKRVHTRTQSNRHPHRYNPERSHANKISGSISRNWDGGLYAMLGTPTGR